MTRERSWTWNFWWCAGLWCVAAAVSFGRHEKAAAFFALLNVVFFATLAEKHHRENNRARWIVGGEDGTELEAKNESQAKMIAGYIALIEAAKDIGISFWWDGKTARAALPDIEVGRIYPVREEKWPQLCHLCNKNMESEIDRTEWHGLGNCVPICPTCSGSGTAD